MKQVLKTHANNFMENGSITNALRYTLPMDFVSFNLVDKKERKIHVIYAFRNYFCLKRKIKKIHKIGIRVDETSYTTPVNPTPVIIRPKSEAKCPGPTRFAGQFQSFDHLMGD